MKKTILVTGANGQLGRAINKLYKDNEEIELYNTDVVETENIHSMNITNIDEVVKTVETVKPYAIINCAAHTNVDGCEKDVDNAYMINAIGPRNLSIASKKTASKLVHISTDYVFPGDGTRPYTEFDTPMPKSIYGKTKLAGEEFVKQFADRYFIIRTAWLYGDGKNFVNTMLRLSETHDEINVVCDQIGSPTSTRVLADIVDNLIWTENYGLYHGTCEGVCSWADFAEEIFRLAGKNTRVNHITSEEYAKLNPASAKRPKYSVLDNYMLKLTTGYTALDWQKAIEEYIKM
ncbi:MAG: dTDP-4-dehydrorhamnose reductase [Lachnospiraceae bacterium]|nr:dTDP-4-dehydrorhamnose reductase [Lachnospiraceae bacterium]MDE6699178.1 dTDP-4-dehydrorhamnose reductase [Lachnospiraceae bacterium]